MWIKKWAQRTLPEVNEKEKISGDIDERGRLKKEGERERSKFV